MKQFFRVSLVVSFFLLLGLLPGRQLAGSGEAQAAPYNTMADPPEASPLVIGEGRDYAASTLSDMWDMSNIQDIYNEKTQNINSDYPLRNDNRMNLDAANGVLYGTAASSDPYIFLVWPGYPQYQNIYKRYGTANPINANLYRYLMFRMYLSDARDESVDFGQVMWSDNLLFTSDHFGISNFFRVKKGWNTYLIDLKTIGTVPGGSLAWSGSAMKMLRLDFTARAGVEVKLDWVRLLADDGNNIPKTTISWEDGSGVLSLYAVYNFGEQDISMPIATGIRAADLSRVWQAGLYPPGDYYIYSIQTKDYAVAAFNEPWDMRSASQFQMLAQLTATERGAEILLTSSSGATDPAMFFHIDTTNTKIDPTLYKYFTFRAKIENQASVSPEQRKAMLYWYPSTGGAWPSNFVPLQADSEYHVYTIDLSANPNWTPMDIVLFRLDPVVTVKSGQQMKFVLDWASLSSEPPTTETDLNPIIGWSDQPLTVQAAPEVEFLNPSYVSGGDFATEVLKDPWDMTQPSDVITSFHITSQDFSAGYDNFLTDGVVIDLTPSGDSQLAMRTGAFFYDDRTPIDPLRYHYLTHDFIEFGAQDTQLGSIHRYIVWANRPEENTTFNAEVTNENWNTYSMDLATAQVEQVVGASVPWSQLPYVPFFIFHPNEIPYFQVRGGYDNVRLTATPWADENFMIRWNIKAGAPTAVVKLYRDTNRAPGGEVLIGQAMLSDGQFNWNTSAVPNGTYYIVLKIDDGLSMERVQYSQVPMIVKRQAKITLAALPATMQGGVDYASDNENPWDFNDDSDLGKNLLPQGYTGLTNITFQDGLMSATSNSTDPYFFLAAPDKIDTARYRRLTFRLRSDYYNYVNSMVDFAVTWSVNNQWYQSSFTTIYPGWGVYTIDLQQYPGWTGLVDYLRIDLASVPGRAFAIDWVRLTEPKVQTLNWSVANSTSNTRVSLYAVPAASACTGASVPSLCSEGLLTIARNLSGVTSYPWDYGGLDGGEYRLIALVDDRISPPHDDELPMIILTAGIPAPRLPVSLTVSAGANQTVRPSSLRIFNDGGGSYSWSAVSLNPSLLTIQPPESGLTISQSEIRYLLHPFGLAPGDYVATVRITVTIDGTPQNYDIPITITVLPWMYTTALPLTTK